MKTDEEAELGRDHQGLVHFTLNIKGQTVSSGAKQMWETIDIKA